MFSVAAVLALAHAFDDALLLPGAGVPLTRHAIALAIAVAATVAVIVKFDRIRPGLRAATAFTFGVLAAVNGGRHAHHIIHEGTTANDVTGVLALAAGVVLIGLAAWIPFAHRGEGASGPVKRWAIRVAVLPLGLLAAMFVYMPVGMAIVDIHSLHRAVGNPPSAEYETLDADHLRRPRPRRLVPPVTQRRGGADAVRRERRHPRHDQPRADARPPRLWRPAVQRAWHR